jgi:hypothetical protein
MRCNERIRKEQPTFLNRPRKCRCGRWPEITLGYYDHSTWHILVECWYCGYKNAEMYHREQIRAWNAAVDQWNTNYGQR